MLKLAVSPASRIWLSGSLVMRGGPQKAPRPTMAWLHQNRRHNAANSRRRSHRQLRLLSPSINADLFTADAWVECSVAFFSKFSNQNRYVSLTRNERPSRGMES